MISSSCFLFLEDVVKIKHYLEKDSCPTIFVDKQVKFFLENKINEKSVTANATNNVVFKFVCPGCKPVTLVRQLAVCQQGLRSI